MTILKENNLNVCVYVATKNENKVSFDEYYSSIVYTNA